MSWFTSSTSPSSVHSVCIYLFSHLRCRHLYRSSATIISYLNLNSFITAIFYQVKLPYKLLSTLVEYLFKKKKKVNSSSFKNSFFPSSIPMIKSENFIVQRAFAIQSTLTFPVIVSLTPLSSILHLFLTLESLRKLLP